LVGVLILLFQEIAGDKNVCIPNARGNAASYQDIAG